MTRGAACCVASSCTASTRQQNLWQRLLDWLGRLFDRASGTASGASWFTTFVTLLVGALLLTGLLVVLSRLRRDRRQRARPTALLPDDRPAAAELRRRAEASYAEGRHEEAVVDGFRALAARQIERGRLDDQPGATAHEVAAPRRVVPTGGPRVGHTADLFDATLYGDRPATPDDAGAVLGSTTPWRVPDERPRPHRTTVLVVLAVLVTVALTAWLGRKDQTYAGALDPRTPTATARRPWPGCSTGRGSRSTWCARPPRSTRPRPTPRPWSWSPERTGSGARRRGDCSRTRETRDSWWWRPARS